MSKPTKSKPTRPISRAELKAYEARRAEESRRIAAPQVPTDGVSSAVARHAYTMSRDEEYSVIRSDLRRLLMIVIVLTAVLVVATLFLR